MTTPAPERISHVTFDIYGTLIDWEQGILDAFAKEAAKAGREVGWDIVRRFDRHEREIQRGPYLPYEEVLAQAAMRAAAEVEWSIPSSDAAFLAESLKDWRPFAGINDQLTRLAGAFKLGVLSNISHALVRGSFAQLDVSFDTVVTADDVRSYKPGRAHFAECRRRLGAEASEWVHVSAHLYHDVEPCNAEDVPILWLNLKREDLGSHTCFAQAASLAEAVDLLLARRGTE
jgi:2-haloacid dehalogenase/putative hydrolase of the HAD superfamily